MNTHQEDQLALEVLTSTEQFESLQPEWEKLMKRVPQHRYFQSYEWNWSVWTHFAEPRGLQLYLLVVKSGDDVVMIWPLVIKRWGLWKIAISLGTESCEYNDVLCSPEVRADECLRLVFNQINREPNISALRLRLVREDARISQFLTEQKSVQGSETLICGVEWSETNSWETYSQALSSKLRSEQRRQRRRLSKEGDWSFENISGEKIPEAIEWLLSHKKKFLESTGRKDHGITSDRYAEFLTRIAQAADQHGHLLLTFLNVNGQPIAGSINFDYGEHLECWICTYDLEWSKYSPGNLLMEHVLETSSTRSSFVDFGPGDQLFKVRWGQQEAKSWHHAYACNLWGKVYCSIWQTKWWYDAHRDSWRHQFGSIKNRILHFLKSSSVKTAGDRSSQSYRPLAKTRS